MEFTFEWSCGGLCKDYVLICLDLHFKSGIYSLLDVQSLGRCLGRGYILPWSNLQFVFGNFKGKKRNNPIDGHQLHNYYDGFIVWQCYD